jgi:SOS response associated peptidase (SRAP)
MCGRFTNRLTWDEIVRLYRLTMKASPHNLPPRYNICPTDPVDVVTESEGSRDFVRMRWGLAPSWWPKPLKELKAATFNAHGETVAESSGLGHFEHLRGAPVYLHRANSAFFRTAASVCPRPSFSSQSATCCIEGAPWIMGFIRPHRPDYQTNPQRSRRLRALADYGASLSVWLGHQPARRPPRPDGRAGRPARAAHVRRNAASALFGCSGGLASPVLCGTKRWRAGTREGQGYHAAFCHQCRYLDGAACGCRMYRSHARSLHEVRRADLAVSPASRRSGVLP